MKQILIRVKSNSRSRHVSFMVKKAIGDARKDIVSKGGDPGSLKVKIISE